MGDAPPPGPGDSGGDGGDADGSVSPSVLRGAGSSTQPSAQTRGCRTPGMMENLLGKGLLGLTLQVG